MMEAFANVSHQVSIWANEMMFWIKPSVIAPSIGPATPPITTAVIEFSVIADPLSAFPDPLSIVIAIPEIAAINPEITYVLNWMVVTGTAVS